MKRVLVVILPMLITLGCAPPMSINYAPSSALTAKGSVDVCDFTYQPAIKGKVKPNQIRNTALGSILIDKNIDEFLREATLKELRFVGVTTQSDKVRLHGNIIEFLIDDLGYSVDWTLQIEYSVTDKSTNNVLYKSAKTFKKRTNKFLNPLGTLNEVVKLNVEELIKDPDFIKVIN
jgi:uncharacterized lipoprotein